MRISASLLLFTIGLLCLITINEGRKRGDIIILGGFGGGNGGFGGGGFGDMLTLGSLFGAFGDGNFIMGRRR